MNARKQYPPKPDLAVSVSELKQGHRYHVVNGRWYFTFVSISEDGCYVINMEQDGKLVEGRIPGSEFTDRNYSSERADESESRDYGELYSANPNCEHDIQPTLSGGVRCTKCSGWFCY